MKRDTDTDSVFSKSKAALPASLPTVDFSTRQGNSVNAPTKNPLPSFFDARRKNPSPIDHTLHNRVAKKDATGPFNPHKFGGEKKKKFQLHLWKPKEKPLASNDEVTIIEKDDNSSEQDDSFEEGDLDIIAEEDTQLCQEKKRKKKIQVIVTTVASVAVANAGIVAAIILL